MTKTNLLGNSVPPVGLGNLAAALARKGASGNQRQMKDAFRQFKKDHRYYGLVPVRVTGNPGVDMILLNDDRVAYHYLFYGQDGYEPFSVWMFSHLAKGCEAVLDVGAYTGLFGLLAARQAPDARVACFEPVPYISARTAENAAVNGLSNLSVFDGAVSAAKGTMRLTLYGSTQATTGASLQTKDKKKSDMGAFDVTVTTIDDYRRETLGGRRIGLIKLDTEGDEMNALAGAATTLREDRPIVLAEVLNDAALDAMAGHMAGLGYSTWFVGERSWRLTPMAKPGEGRIGTFSVDKHGFGNVLLFREDSHGRAIRQMLAARPVQG